MSVLSTYEIYNGGPASKGNLFVIEDVGLARSAGVLTVAVSCRLKEMIYWFYENIM